ncbi:hypothetical protein BsIDN1_41370 [Bacillus safensis]|uniref:Uncharacterized protein n=1 Tax=Bacillus safensis TaxID=561879 RepID=A0A5S9MF56_BACIA|nr:hypothetical protein BsIDN1_41370 [Bacillus safensis]
MIFADVARFIIGLGFVLVVTMNVTPFILYLLLALNGAFSGIYLPARSSMIPEILDKEQLSKGIVYWPHLFLAHRCSLRQD